MPLLTDGLPYTGYFREIRPLVYELFTPDLAKRYAEKISKVTGIPLTKVVKSTPFMNYFRKITGVRGSLFRNASSG